MKKLTTILTMKKEVLDFFEKHLKEINGQEFWNKCKDEFPYKTIAEIKQ